MLFDGVSSFAERTGMIDGARDDRFQTFVFNSDQTGWELAKRSKAKEGVAVRVIYDVVGSKAADPKMFDFMRQGGVDEGLRRAIQSLGHQRSLARKHLIVDGKVGAGG